MSRTAPTLESLPQELFDQILSYLIHPDHCFASDVFPIRLASRTLQQKSNNVFGALVFSGCKLDFTTRSLQRFQALADRYGPHARKLLIECDDEAEWNDDSRHGWKVAELDEHCLDVDDRRALEAFGRDSYLLAAILKATPNVEEVEILVPLREECEVQFREEYKTRVLCDVVLAALQVSRVRLRAFVVRSEKMAMLHSDTPFGYAPLVDGMWNGQVFDGLETLALPLGFGPEHFGPGEKEHEEHWRHFTTRLKEFPLKHLDMNVAFYDWLPIDADAVISRLSDGWPDTLTHLSLSNLVVRASTLRAFFSTARDGMLQSVSLRCTDLSTGTWHSVLASVKASLSLHRGLILFQLLHLGQQGMQVHFNDYEVNEKLFRCMFEWRPEDAEAEFERLMERMTIINYTFDMYSPFNYKL